MYQYENGIKKKNVGYVRVESKNGQCKFTIHMQLPGQPDSIFPTYLIHRDNNGLDLIYLGDCLLKGQLIDSRFNTEERSIMNSGHSLDQMSGILIFMNNNLFFATLWDDYKLNADELLLAMKMDRSQARSEVKPDIPDKDEKGENKLTESGRENVSQEKDPEEKAAEKRTHEVEVRDIINTDMSSENETEQNKTEEDKTKKNEDINKASEIAAISEEKEKEENKLNEPEEQDDNDMQYFGEKLSLEEELKIPTYKFPRGLKTVEMFRRSMAMAEKIADSEKADKAADEKCVAKEAEKLQQLQQESRPDKAGAERAKEAKAAAVAESKSNESKFDRKAPDLDSIITRFNRLYPFEDNEIILCAKIEPKDIGLLPNRFWHLSSNSFLLHGFYCYHHLILAKMKYKDKAIYILGVPGLYQPKEQFMARMFGFDSFKSIKKREPKKGDFGYWYLQLNC